MCPPPKIRRNKFTASDDMMLRHAVARAWPDWSEIAAQVPGKNIRQCKERWLFYLNPALDKSAWTEEQDNLLLRQVGQIGPIWTQIIASFPGRTCAMLKNRYKRLRRREQRESRFLNETSQPIKMTQIPQPMFFDATYDDTLGILDCDDSWSFEYCF